MDNTLEKLLRELEDGESIGFKKDEAGLAMTYRRDVPNIEKLYSCRRFIPSIDCDSTFGYYLLLSVFRDMKMDVDAKMEKGDS
jgi:hypothetical protein